MAHELLTLSKKGISWVLSFLQVAKLCRLLHHEHRTLPFLGALSPQGHQNYQFKLIYRNDWHIRPWVLSVSVLGVYPLEQVRESTLPTFCATETSYKREEKTYSSHKHVIVRIMKPHAFIQAPSVLPFPFRPFSPILQGLHHLLLLTSVAYPFRILITVTELLKPQREASLNFLIARTAIANEVVTVTGSPVWSASGLIVRSIANARDVSTFLANIDATLQTWQCVASIAFQIPHSDFNLFIVCFVSRYILVMIRWARVRAFEFLAQYETFSAA
jgi:hypothetical protein